MPGVLQIGRSTVVRIALATHNINRTNDNTDDLNIIISLPGSLFDTVHQLGRLQPVRVVDEVGHAVLPAQVCYLGGGGGCVFG